MRKIIIAGTHSGAGKTTVANGIMASLTQKGYKVQCFKVGPDYIDPGFHTIATGRVSRNLDTWMLGEDSVKELFYRASQDADISVIEGVMGLFDGSGKEDFNGSTAHVARLLDAPVILVLDVKSMAASAAAIVLGFKNLDPRIKIAGVILNRVGSPRHRRLVEEAIQQYTQIPVLGCLNRLNDLSMPERHLGLVPAAEQAGIKEQIDRVGSVIGENIDLNKVMEISESPVPEHEVKLFQEKSAEKVRIAIARDEAFTFYYQDGLDILGHHGAELVPFSPLHDKELPQNIGGIYIGGGYPEMFLNQLGQNESLMEEIRSMNAQGMPIYAECGGLMYLCEAIKDFEGNSYPMVGLVPGITQMEKRLVAMGYVSAAARTDNLLCQKDEELRGHVFHYSSLKPVDEEFNWAFNVTNSRREGQTPDGFVHKNLLASYFHFHFAANPSATKRFVQKCLYYKKNNQ